MPDYAVFGGCLRSELPLVGVPLAKCGCRPDWVLRKTHQVPRLHVPTAVGIVENATDVRLYRLPDGWRLEYPDTGVYDVSNHGAAITWHPAPRASLELVQADILGRVLALALSISGMLPLHGSAVARHGTGLVFVGPKHYGKSTLAAALTSAGARLVSDDMAAVVPTHPPVLRPGVPQLRLWTDSASCALAATPATRTAGLKDTFSNLPAARTETTSTVLGGIYILSPADLQPESKPAVREPLRATEATLALLQHSKLGSLMPGSLAGDALRQSAAVVNQVPVYLLRVTRDLNRLSDVAHRILDWHTSPERRLA